MSLGLKVAATFGVATGAAIAMVEVALQAVAAQSPGLTGNPVVDGLIGGGTVTVVAIAVMKTRLDRVERDVEKKADKEHISDRLTRIEAGLDQVRKHLMGE